MIPTTPTRKHQNLRPGFCRISRICLHLDNIGIIRDRMWPSSAHVWCLWLSWYHHDGMRYDHKWSVMMVSLGLKRHAIKSQWQKLVHAVWQLFLPFTFLCPIFVSSFFFLSSCRSIALGNLSCKCYLHPHLPKFSIHLAHTAEDLLLIITTSWFGIVIFKVRNKNLQLTNGKPLSFTTLSQPYVHWCSWIPCLLYNPTRKRNSAQWDFLDSDISISIMVGSIWVIHIISHIISSANPLHPAPPPPTPPQIDEYSRCAYVVHRCVVVSRATKGPMHGTFKALFCTMEHTRYVHHTRSNVLVLNSKLI
jgi:hypothetical protein